MGVSDTRLRVGSHIGLIGGMGPKSTVHFYDMLLKRTKANTDQEHIPIALLIDPAIPDRTAYVLDEGESPWPKLKANIDKLKRLDVGCYGVLCNTAHVFEDAFKLQDMTFISVPHEAVKRLEGDAVLLSTKGTVKGNVYARHDGKPHRIENPDDDTLAMVNEAIYRIKADEERDVVANDVVSHLVEAYNKDTTFLLACTELSMISDYIAEKFTVVDSVECLVDALIAWYKTNK